MAEGRRPERSRQINYEFDDLGRVMNRDEVQQQLIDFEAVLAAIGGMLVVGAIRAVAVDGTYLTVGVKLEWKSFAPAVGQIPELPEPDPEPEPLEVHEPDTAGALEEAEAAEEAVEPELKPVA